MTTTIIRCPDFPLTDALRAHLGRRFARALEPYRSRASLV